MINGRYKHYKGGVVVVIAIATDVNTMNKVVIYVDTYRSQKIWTRNYDEFNELVNGVPRFEKIEELGD